MQTSVKIRLQDTSQTTATTDYGPAVFVVSAMKPECRRHVRVDLVNDGYCERLVVCDADENVIAEQKVMDPGPLVIALLRVMGFQSQRRRQSVKSVEFSNDPVGASETKDSP